MYLGTLYRAERCTLIKYDSKTVGVLYQCTDSEFNGKYLNSQTRLTRQRIIIIM